LTGGATQTIPPLIYLPPLARVDDEPHFRHSRCRARAGNVFGQNRTLGLRNSARFVQSLGFRLIWLGEEIRN